MNGASSLLIKFLLSDLYLYITWTMIIYVALTFAAYGVLHCRRDHLMSRREVHELRASCLPGITSDARDPVAVDDSGSSTATATTDGHDHGS